MNYVVIDIETLSQPERDIRAKIPPFDETKVALGTASKPETVASKIAEARRTHGDDIVAKAALHAEYGTVAIVGLWDDAGYSQLTIGVNDESVILAQAWGYMVNQMDHGSHIITGWNIKGFDLPFLVKRSWILGVKVPSRIFNPYKPRYPWSECIVDLMEVYSCADYRNKYTSQNAACVALGIEPNSGSGADFGELWKRDKTAALSYNSCDLERCAQLAERLIG